jgi:FXSXX-COOH protein
MDVTGTPLRELRRTGPTSALASVIRQVVDEVVDGEPHVQEQKLAD